MKTAVTLGGDPEFFLQIGGNTIIPGIGLVGGTKEKPRKFRKFKTAVQEDNVTVEFNPQVHPIEFSPQVYKSLEDTTDFVRGLLRKKLKTEIDFIAKESHVFTDDQLHDPSCWVIGCDPDFNAWNGGRPNEYPPLTTTTRNAGGHIHFGFPKTMPSKEEQMELIKYLDVYVGLPCAILELTPFRLKSYGTPGNFRFKPYGIEYRTPSAVMWANAQIFDLMIENAKRAISAWEANKYKWPDGRWIGDLKRAFIHKSTEPVQDLVDKYKPYFK